MTTHTQLLEAIADRNLSKHPFYQAWMKGELTQEQLGHYAVQYYPHVSAFPRFVSSVHALCENQRARKLLFTNLSEEEGAVSGDDHPELWLRFAEGLGVDRAATKSGPYGKKARELVDVFFSLCRDSYASGLGALTAYEIQVPEIADLKIDGLKRFYQIEDARTIAFFDVHRTADRFHSDACIELLEALPEAEKQKAHAAAQTAANALWDFLTEVYEAPCEAA
jgi:pyrroloquinoline-quinone synthase